MPAVPVELPNPFVREVEDTDALAPSDLGVIRQPHSGAAMTPDLHPEDGADLRGRISKPVNPEVGAIVPAEEETEHPAQSVAQPLPRGQGVLQSAEFALLTRIMRERNG